MTLSSIILVVGMPLGILFLLLVAYGLWTLLGALVPVHPKFRPSSNGVDIYLSTNGMHTNFILPVKNEIFDWTHFMDHQLYEINLHSNALLSFGWGDQAIYLDLPAWNQLTLKLALRTLFLPTPALLHIEAHLTPPPENTVHTRISKEQYAQLCQFIFSTFKLGQQNDVQLVPGAGYTANDQFYQAEGKYHVFNTCNTWVNEGLKQIGVRTAWWTNIDRSLFYQLKKVKAPSDKMIFENQG